MNEQTDQAHVGVPGDVAHSDAAIVVSQMDGVVFYDRDLRIVRVNRTVEETRRVRPEHLGRPITEAFPDADVNRARSSWVRGGWRSPGRLRTRFGST